MSGKPLSSSLPLPLSSIRLATGARTTPALVLSRTLAGLAFALIAACPLQAQCLDYTQGLHWLGGAWFNAPSSLDVAVQGNYAYVACQESGLRVVDISDPEHPVAMGGVDTPGSARDIAVAGDFAYVADHSAGLQVVDISGPAPQIVLGLPTPDTCFGVAVAWPYAYVAVGMSGLIIVDISDPGAAAVVGAVDTPGTAYGIALDGTTAYVATGEGLRIIDVSDPESPRPLSGIAASHYAETVAFLHGYVYVGGGPIDVFDVRNPAAPQLVTTVEVPGWAGDLAAGGTTIWIANYDTGLSVLDVAVPVLPELRGSVHTPGHAAGVVIDGNRAFVVGLGGGLQIFQTSDLPFPAVTGALDTPGSATNVALGEGYAVVADQDSGLQVVDLSEPSSPQIIGSLGTGDRACEVALRGTVACVARNELGLLVVDLTNPAAPESIGAVDTPGWAYTVAAQGDLAYLGVLGAGAGLYVIDILDLSRPFLRGFLPVEFPNDVAVRGSLAYLACANGLLVVDVSDPDHPWVVGSASPPSWPLSEDVALDGDFAYVADANHGLLVVDVSEPAAPEIVGTSGTPDYCMSVAIDGAVAYLSDVMTGIVLVTDVTDPTDPHVIGNFPVDLGAGGIAVLGTNLILSVYDFGLRIIPAQCEAATSPVPPSTAGLYLRQFPNPCRGESCMSLDLPLPGRVRLEIHDVSGRAVRHLFDGECASGTNSWLWDGRDDRGRPVPGGVYFTRAQTAAGRVTGVLTRLQ